MENGKIYILRGKMISAYKKLLIRALLNKNAVGGKINLVRHFVTYPKSPYVFGGGINIIHRCNLDCKFCVYGLGKRDIKMPDMDEKTFTKCLDIKAYKHALIFNLGSGEPLLHKDVFKFIKKIQDRGQLVSIASNGTLMGARMNELIRTPPDFMWISLYDKHEKIQVKNIRTFMKKKPRKLILGISKIIGKKNLKDMERILKLAAESGIKNVWFQQFLPPFPSKSKTSLFNQLIFTDDEKSIAFIDKVKRLQKKKYSYINCSFPNPLSRRPLKPFCPFLYRGFSIEPNGAIQPCCTIHPMGREDYGNIFKDESAHLHNKKYMDLKESFKSGKLKDICQYCYAVNLK